ncbi:MAG: phenylacetate-CoA oxygenase subunit PaaJ [Roseiflexaceae bacterium]
MTTLSEDAIWSTLAEVPDPELPHISLVDLGVILRVELDAPARRARVLLMPTFLGCPALQLMREQIAERLALLGLDAQVEVTMEQIWTSDRISESGRSKLAAAGIAPPAPNSTASGHSALIPLLESARCPHCGSRDTTMESLFGPTLCRAIAHCRSCRQPFEQFKPI